MMTRARLSIGVLLFCAALSGTTAFARRDASHADRFDTDIPTTLVTLPYDSEGLTVDPDTQTIYTAEAPDASGDCVVHSVTMGGVVSFVGVVPKPAGPCAPRGLEFRAGHLYIADQGTGANGWVFEMNIATGVATTFAADVAGANGIAFDSQGNLWITDGLRGLGRVYRRDAATGVVLEAFRVPPVSNGTINGGLLGVPASTGIGRQILNLPVGPIGEVKAVANGVAVVERHSEMPPGAAHFGIVYVADTARGAIWAVRLDHHRNVVPGQTGCDSTLQADTLCEDALFVAHPRLEGADGMWADADGTLLVAANGRQGMVRVDRWANVIELFRNPVNAQLLRSSADSSEGDRHILEYPTSPVIVPGARRHGERTLCVTSTDRPGRDNWPGTVGEIGGPGQNKGKISCFE
jgi:streptogramin lyase